MIVRSELYFPDIDFELPDPPVPVAKPHQTLAQRLRQKLAKDPPPPPVNHSQTPYWEWPNILRDMDGMLENLKDRFHVRLPMEKVDIELVRRSSLVPRGCNPKSRLIITYGETIDGLVIGGHTRTSDGQHLIRVGYYGDQCSKTATQVKRTLTHELGHVLGEFPLFDIIFDELKAHAMEDLLMGRPETVANVTGSWVHDNSRRMLAHLGEIGICEPAILAHVTGVSFGEYGPQSYRDLRRF